MKTILKKHLITALIGAAVVVAGAGAIWYVSTSHPPTFSGTTAMRGNVVASLDEAGTIAAENNANLSFQEGGQIAHVYVTEGQTVAQGTALADLSSASLEAGTEQAKAALASAQARLDSLTTGTRPEQLAIDQTAVTNARAALSVDVSNAYTSADDAVHNQTDNLFNNPKTNNPTFLISISNTQELNNIQSARVAVEGVLSAWYTAISAPSPEFSYLAATSNSDLNQVKAYLDQLALGVNDATPNANITTSVLAGYRTSVAAARAEVGAAITTLTTAQATLATAQNALTLAQAGSTAQDIEAQQAVVAQAQAAATAAQVALNNASLIAPFSGSVQNLTAQIGQVVSPGAPVLTLVNNGGLKIQTYVSEADVAKIKIGDAAQVTLDAFGTATKFDATVTTVDAVKTTVNGSPAYLVTLHFKTAQPQIKDGMTGNVHIILAEDDNVVEVPSRLVINNGNGYFVLVATATGTVQKAVTIGLIGGDGTTEILSGINAGDTLTNF